MAADSKAGAKLPEPPRQSGDAQPDAINSIAASWTRRLFSDPNRVAIIFWAGGVGAITATFPIGHWSHRSFLTLIAIAGFCCAAAVVRYVGDRKLPREFLHVDVIMATALASILAGIGSTNHVPFSYLYIWVSLFVALYLPARAVIGYTAGIDAAYALVLAIGPHVVDPGAAWLALFGTTLLAAAVIFGLTTVLRSTARTDPLTGLPNRRMWDERVEEEMVRSERSGAPLSVVMIDLDAFKAINDARGHDAGDLLLQELAQTFRQVIRGGGDFLARLGGDEFSVLAPDSEEIGARALAKRLAAAMPPDVSTSMGIATWDRTENASGLLRRADEAMYRIKQRHRRDAGRGSA